MASKTKNNNPEQNLSLRREENHSLARTITNVALSATLAFTAIDGCSTLQSLKGTAYGNKEARTVMEVQEGNLANIRQVTIEGDNTNNYNIITGSSTAQGAAVGAVVGGVVGNEAGQGKTKGITTAIGVAAGAAGGAIVGHELGKRAGIELTVRLKNGTLVAVVQEADNKVSFAVGQHVEVIKSGQNTAHVEPMPEEQPQKK